ncbi:hypothetical protein GOALK_016_01320 [Gordonia alkanivorans NBRC 16433]|uniref:Uncharacterized protein n=2 Tax=Gordonia alkanivorans TaxID=84096 RepID=F9VQX0_9ACTN|nr:hypothetical protein GOALK_016_01320 [Gordonia alkanivorans NBRC 16433]
MRRASTGIVPTEDNNMHKPEEPHYRGEQAAAERIAEKYGVRCSSRFVKTETESGRLAVVIFAHQRWYAESDLDAWFASKRKVLSTGGAA